MKKYKEGEYLIEERATMKIIYKIITVGLDSIFLEDLADNFSGNYDIVDIDRFCNSQSNTLNNFKKYFLENENNS